MVPWHPPTHCDAACNRHRALPAAASVPRRKASIHKALVGVARRRGLWARAGRGREPETVAQERQSNLRTEHDGRTAVIDPCPYHPVNSHPGCARGGGGGVGVLCVVLVQGPAGEYGKLVTIAVPVKDIHWLLG